MFRLQCPCIDHINITAKYAKESEELAACKPLCMLIVNTSAHPKAVGQLQQGRETSGQVTRSGQVTKSRMTCSTLCIHE